MSVGMEPLGFLRDTLSLVSSESLLLAEEAALATGTSRFERDIVERARRYKKALGNPGAYSHSQGAPGLREEVASFFERRDADEFLNYDSRPSLKSIFLTNGASDGLDTILQCLLGGDTDAVLLPCPQYPLYAATVTKMNGHVFYYGLNEDKDWSFGMGDMQAAYDAGVKAGKDVKAIVVISPGNPAPSLPNREQIECVLRFAAERNLAVIADEVYQDNIYIGSDDKEVDHSVASTEEMDLRLQTVYTSPKNSRHQTGSETSKPAFAEAAAGAAAEAATEAAIAATAVSPGAQSSCSTDSLTGLARSGSKFPEPAFLSFRKVLLECAMKDVQLVSVHSASKGYFGECGLRGGVMQVENLDDEALAMLYKMRSITLCSNTLGQVALTTILNPPMRGEASWKSYIKEKSARLTDMKEKAILMTQKLNEMPGISSARIRAAMYAFPSIQMPEKAIAAAAEKQMSVELLYCLELLEETGIVTTPGDGFGQKEGTHHIRLTILPSKQDLIQALESFKEFHINFLQRYA